MQNRVKLLYVIFVAVFIVLIARLFFWQIIRGSDLSQQARNQYEYGQTIAAPRGNILASDGSWLVGKGEAWLVYASIPEVKSDPESISQKLAPLFIEDDFEDSDEKRQALLAEIDRLDGLLRKKEVVWVPLKNKIDRDTKTKIESLEIMGIGFEAKESRLYPEASSAAHLLGFVGKNKEGADEGYFGLEGYYDLILSGKPGFLSRESDAKGTPILTEEMKEVSAIQGVDLVTNIDKTIQLAVDKKLKEGIDKFGASGGTVIVMNPANGAILAMSSYPSFDPNKYYNFGNEYFRNTAISDSFEPGSVFKVLVMAAGLDADEVKPDTKCDICNTALKVDKYYIKTWNQEYHPDSTMTEVIVNSDNVGMAFVSGKLGADKMYDYLQSFGIGNVTGVDLQGESSPKLREKGTWNIVDLATAGFGQGIAVTPMQMTRAVAVIANDGVITTPQVVDKLSGVGWEEDIEPIMGDRVISKKAADEMTAMMEEAVKKDEARWTHLEGFRVAGKTGTAQIPIAGHYDEEKTMATFVGFAPSNDPKFVMLVTLREPTASPWAAGTSAPLWYSIAEDIFLRLGIHPED